MYNKKYIILLFEKKKKLKIVYVDLNNVYMRFIIIKNFLFFFLFYGM